MDTYVTVEHLLNIHFSSLPLEKKIEIKKEGRPMPNLNIIQIKKTKSREFKRSFNKDIYSKHDWLCGCSKTNRLFCFPCILFCRTSGDKNWSQNGINDLAHLNNKMSTHIKSTLHLNAHLNLKLLGKQDIRQQLSNAFRLSIQKHDETVTNNRYILSKIIDCIKFCGAFELALRGHNEKSDSENPGIFRGLINFSSELDNTLKLHLEQSTVFKGLSKIIQNEMLECKLFVIRQNIKNEIKNADFFSVISNETIDVSAQFQMSIIFRYILSNGTPVERFWGFFNPSGHDAKSLSECIKYNLKEVTENHDKLISQSYDGAAVMSGRLSGVQKLIKDEYKNAHFVHCYAHQLNLILSQATMHNRDVRIFFSNLTDVTNFFSNSPQRVAVLDKVVNPRSSNTRWNFKSRIVNTVHENRELLIECMEEIENTFNQNIAINQACAIHILYNQLQKRKIDSTEVKNAISRFEENIQKERRNFDNFQNEMPGEVTQCRQKRKRDDDTLLSRICVAKEVCDILIVCVKDRFEYKAHLRGRRTVIFRCAKIQDEFIDSHELTVSSVLEVEKSLM
ncbi:zinc finger MYM-type protein 1-like [Sipha flava]|uniref:Zinc finger MYM-type protein 1-like n=1 Tax=Sipha flava TaxID=143950 RepID=A0A8B8GE74_9HEMI|nr:zinc finger MYM-type protein 1-like [Sipha flava]